MLVPQAFLNCCLYIYPSKADAERGTLIGGTGFLVTVPIPSETTLAWQLYVVTAKHVISKLESPVLRINLMAGGFESVETNNERWSKCKDADLAVLSLGLEYEKYRYWFIHIEEFVDSPNTQGVGIGDDTFMVGRFVSQDGEQQNTPTARFGNISMMPNAEQPNFLVEHRSLPGFSGSPVFVWINPGLLRLPYAKVELNPHYDPMKYGPWLLGIDSCHLQNYNALLNSNDDKDIAIPLRWVKANTGMAEIVPAWKLADVLHSEAFTIQRERYGRDIDSRKSI
jgi:hypothetical protein